MTRKSVENHLPGPLRSVEPSTSQQSDLPPLPSTSRPSPLSQYALSTHIVPSSVPRSTPYVATLDSVSAFKSSVRLGKQSRPVSKRATDELISLKKRFEEGQISDSPSTSRLWNCVNRFVRVDGRAQSKASFTILCTHATGMHKETFEPLLLHLVEEAEKGGMYDVSEIWAFEAVQHGDAALINASHLGLLYDWTDNTRDVLNFLLHYLPDKVTSGTLPTHLERVPDDVANTRLQSGFAHRRLFGIGHSFGGTTLIHAVYQAPLLFAHNGLVLFDPVVQPREQYVVSHVWSYVHNSLTRRSSWSSRAEAYRHLKASPFFGRWEDGVLRLFVDRGLYELKSGEVGLKCDNVQEAIVFADLKACADAWTFLPHIDSRIALKWVVPPVPKSVLKDADVMAQRARRRPGNTSHVVIETGSHMLVQDSPRESAHEVHLLLQELTTGPRSRL